MARFLDYTRLSLWERNGPLVIKVVALTMVTPALLALAANDLVPIPVAVVLPLVLTCYVGLSEYRRARRSLGPYRTIVLNSAERVAILESPLLCAVGRAPSGRAVRLALLVLTLLFPATVGLMRILDLESWALLVVLLPIGLACLLVMVVVQLQPRIEIRAGGMVILRLSVMLLPQTVVLRDGDLDTVEIVPVKSQWHLVLWLVDRRRFGCWIHSHRELETLRRLLSERLATASDGAGVQGETG